MAAVGGSRCVEKQWMSACSAPAPAPRVQWQGFAGVNGDGGGRAASRGANAPSAAAARALCCSSSSSSSSSGKRDSRGGDTIRVVFVDRDGDEYVIDDAPVGESMLEIAHANDVELEGACEGSLACSTCHVIVEDEDVFDGLPEATDDENDMLDLAFGLTETYVRAPPMYMHVCVSISMQTPPSHIWSLFVSCTRTAVGCY